MSLILIMTKVFLKIFSKDRQAIFFSLFFPVIFMLVFGLVSDQEEDPIALGIFNQSGTALSQEFIDTLGNLPFFELTEDDEDTLRQSLIAGDLSMVLLIPDNFQDNGSPVDLTLLVDASQVRQVAMVMPVLEDALVDVERDLRNIEPLFNLNVEDVQSRSQTYLDFLVPGLLAFTLMQIAIAGSGYNIVEYRRKGILKRLFVTPIKSSDFIGGLVISRMLVCLVQLSLLLGIATFLLGVTITGSFLNLYFVIIAGTVIFLSIGFCMGSLAQTQGAIMAIGNLVTLPQMLLSGIFYPIDILPALIQPLAKILPLSFIAGAMRGIAIDGSSLLEMLPSLTGLVVWIIVALALAIRLFNWKKVAS